MLSALSFLELKTNTGTARSKVRHHAAPTTLRLLIERRELRDLGDHGAEPRRRSRRWTGARDAHLGPAADHLVQADLPLPPKSGASASPSTRT